MGRRMKDDSCLESEYGMLPPGKHYSRKAYYHNANTAEKHDSRKASSQESIMAGKHNGRKASWQGITVRGDACPMEAL